MLKWVGGAIALATLLVACGGRPRGVPPSAVPTVGAGSEALRVTEQDVYVLVAVKAKALRQLEEAVDAAERQGGDMVSRVKELPAAERDAALALGVDWQRYVLVRDEIARLVSQNRQREDAELMALELTRAKQDLAAQLEAVRDPASRSFLQAQIASLNEQLEKIERGHAAKPEEQEELRLLEGVRAEMAALQAQQEKLQKRIRDLVQGAGVGPPRRPSEREPVK